LEQLEFEYIKIINLMLEKRLVTPTKISLMGKQDYREIVDPSFPQILMAGNMVLILQKKLYFRLIEIAAQQVILGD